MRRRAAKLLTCIKADSFDFAPANSQPVDGQADEICQGLEKLAIKLQSDMADDNISGEACHHACRTMEIAGCMLATQDGMSSNSTGCLQSSKTEVEAFHLVLICAPFQQGVTLVMRHT